MVALGNSERIFLLSKVVLVALAEGTILSILRYSESSRAPETSETSESSESLISSKSSWKTSEIVLRALTEQRVLYLRCGLAGDQRDGDSEEQESGAHHHVDWLVCRAERAGDD